MSSWKFIWGRIFRFCSRNMKNYLMNLIILVLFVRTQSKPCAEYGCPGKPAYQPFVPAPRGLTPKCARGRNTFCETVDDYPEQLIKFLVQKCILDLSSILKDESITYSDTYSPQSSNDQGYDYPKQDVHQFQQQSLPLLQTSSPFKEEFPVINRPVFNRTYDTSLYSQRAQFRSNVQFNVQSNGQPSEKYHSNFHRQETSQEKPSVQVASQYLNLYNQHQTTWFTRHARNNKEASSTLYENPLLEYPKNKKNRNKRQFSSESIVICPTSPRYITPKAALNNQGSWKYIVNLKEKEESYSQIIRSEVCQNTACDALCSIPEGYTSECKQQFVQKKLVALDGSGDTLYFDNFWFPHGCSCQVNPQF